MADISALVDDLQTEHDELDKLLTPLSDQQWDLDTPADGWRIRDQVAHLAFFDGAMTQSITDAPAFLATLAIRRDTPDYVNVVAAPLAALPAATLLDRWRAGCTAVTDAMRHADPATRVAWYGPPMSLASACTARLMETWAHGQDIVDTLGIDRPATDRIQHVLHIGYRARAFAYRNRGLDVPTHDIRFEVTAPNGTIWTYGQSQTDVIRGPALDLALVLTQRRHPDDTDLTTQGHLADEFLALAQAYAGKPGTGRRPGQFPRARG
ncbi:TIGR03084 family protein [Gordonia sp. TBRC 11910]|uniref:TIGR03084 family protein n=1 Tax=Gordonia asplenii TaxID=2725283 RepID=A0A848KV26_9ACTN|nr:TIGR03084 family metal-binding protein [Gordonia asplenii]NMO00041.1 TIGR03084 family protein [Gordonia asplenii]